VRRRIFDKENHAYFVTFSCYRRRRLLDNDRAKGIVVHFLSAQLKNQKGICIGFVIMPDHVHAMIAFQETDYLSTFMSQWKRRSSIQLKNFFKSVMNEYGKQIDLDEPMWQAKYYCFNVYSERKIREKLTYMHNNPVKSGLVDHPEDWRFGSARWYLLNKPVGVSITKVA
jgi:putative transposase